jgi:hypothetical protein
MRTAFNASTAFRAFSTTYNKIMARALRLGKIGFRNIDVNVLII